MASDLRSHINEFHRRPVGGTAGLTATELRGFHKDQHRHQECDHTHGGPVVGEFMPHPEGLDTGDHMTPSAPR